MTVIARFNTILYVLLTACILMSGLAAHAGDSNPGLEQAPMVRAKAPVILTENAREFLQSRDSQTAKVWVFFTDKQVFTKGEFVSLATSVKLSDKVLKRRAKVSMDRVVFADLPVSDHYINSIINRGGNIRRVSKWLNAASFDIPHDKLASIAELDFVSSMKPVAGFKRIEAPEQLDRVPDLPQSLDSEILNYGESQGQLNQINVPVLHEAGYTGQGVTLAIFDTGFRKSHEAFAQHIAEGRLLAEYDFIFDDEETSNEPADVDNQWSHGTETWSVAAGRMDGTLYGPAYGANYLLAKTEDEASETPVEEDNWVAALEWADSLGVDVVSSSVGYADWYDSADFDGATATITIAANTADALGIIICQSTGNYGPSPGALGAPADAFNILSCGSVSSSGVIATSSSRGPTADGRIKPEVCAQGVMDFMAKSSGDDRYGYGNGTSFSTPLVAGAVCLLIEAQPTFTPAMIRAAIMETASQGDAPDNVYGWGIVDLEAALLWGANFEADILTGTAPLTVQFTDLSAVGPTAWHWDFGDGTESFDQNPSHDYDTTGIYDVTLTVQSPFGEISSTRYGYIMTLADTLVFASDSVVAGDTVSISVNLTNSQPLQQIKIPFQASDTPIDLTWIGYEAGSRTSYFEDIRYVSYSTAENRFAIQMTADDGGGASPLAPGSGQVLVLKFLLDTWAAPDLVNTIDSTQQTSHDLELVSSGALYQPVVVPGEIRSSYVKCGDINRDGKITLSDITAIIALVYIDKIPIQNMWSADINGSGNVTLSDITGIIDHVYISKAPIYCAP